MKKEITKINILKYIAFIAVILFCNNHNLSAQTTTAMELYNSKFYQSALDKFNQLIEQSADVKNGKKIMKKFLRKL